jgi:hypothetical protein
MRMTLRPTPRKSFYVAVFHRGRDRNGWCWEIRRKRRPMGVRLAEGDFSSHRAAQAAGRSALEDFLNGLAMDAVARSQQRP